MPSVRDQKLQRLHNAVGALGQLTREEDIKAVSELDALADGRSLEAYLLDYQQKVVRESDRPVTMEKSTPRPLQALSIEQLTALQSHWHSGIVLCASEELARRQLIHFTQQTYSNYIANWHHVEYARVLDDFIAGKIKRLMVFMGPQHGKSELCSRRMPAKLLGDNPDLRIGLVSYNHVFASGFNRDIQRIIDSEEYRTLYPGTTLGASNIRTVSGNYLRNADEFEIVGHRGSLLSVGVGGGLTGRRIDVLIIDDPYKDQKSAWSPTTRRSIQSWYDSVADTRLHNDSRVLLTMTRWHQDDLASYILKNEPDKWTVVRFQSVKEGPPLPYDPRQPGEALWPEMHGLEGLLSLKKRNPYVFGAMHQQDPKPAEGLLFPPDSLHYFTNEDIADVEFDSLVAVSDVADKGTDYYCMIIAGLRGERIYILDVIYTQEPVKVTIPLTVGKLREWSPSKHRIESNAGGSIYAATIKEKNPGPTTIEDKATSVNKETRILLSSGQVLEYCWFLQNAPAGSQYEAFLSAVTGYLLAGGNEHDDAPDAITMLVGLVHPMKSETQIKVLNNEPPKEGKLARLYNRLKNMNKNW